MVSGACMMTAGLSDRMGHRFVCCSHWSDDSGTAGIFLCGVPKRKCGKKLREETLDFCGIFLLRSLRNPCIMKTKICCLER